VQRLYIDVLRWESVTGRRTADCTSMADVARKVGRSLEDLLLVDGQVPRAVRVTLPAARRCMARCSAMRASCGPKCWGRSP
jgi:hypothetical protein